MTARFDPDDVFEYGRNHDTSDPHDQTRPANPDLPASLADEMAANLELRQMVGELQRRKRAREILTEIEEHQHPKPAPDAALLADLLKRPEQARWRIDGLLPASGRMLLSAQAKTGKTTTLGNLTRSLLTGEPFLDRFDVTKIDGRVVILNYEVTGETFARWMHDIGVPPDRLFIINLRGRRNLLADSDGRAELAELIHKAEGEILGVDPFGRAYTGKSQNDTAEVTPWLLRLDELAEQAGVAELVVTAHTGWDGERTRGSSGLVDWPDVTVVMTRDPDDGARFIKAEGRDVAIDEDRLNYDPVTRRLTLSGAGNRKQVRKDSHHERLAEAVRDIVTEHPGINVSELRDALRERDEHLQHNDANKAARLAEDRGWVRRERGPRNSWKHFPINRLSIVPSSTESYPVPQVSSTDPYLSTGTTYTTTQESSGTGTGQPPESNDDSPDPPVIAVPSDCPTCHWPLDSQGHQVICSDRR